MDYLVFVEHDAECLQFFLWYIDYAERWSRLLPRQRFLSPRWDPLVDKSVDKDVDDYASSPEFLAELRKLDNVLAIMEETHKEAESARASRVSSRHASKSSLGNFTFGHHSRRSSEVANSHILHSSISGDLGTIDSAEDSEWQPCKPCLNPLNLLLHTYLWLTRTSHNPTLS